MAFLEKAIKDRYAYTVVECKRDDVKNLYIPVPNIVTQQEIVSELRNRRKKARDLKQSAESEWQSAKEQFEKELLQ